MLFYIGFFIFVVLAPQIEAQDFSYERLQSASDAFGQAIRFPTQTNLIRQYAVTTQRQNDLTEMALSVHPLIHGRVMGLIQAFIEHKNHWGTQTEKKLYANMLPEDLVDRLLKKRPIMFMNPDDDYLLITGMRGQGGFESIGTEKEQPPLLLENYLSYDEMAISAMVDVSVPTYFINDGARNNLAIKGKEGTFQPKGIYIALVGCRFERPGLMEWAHIMITEEQNRPENGYGKHADYQNPKNKLLETWARFYLQGDPDKACFPSYDEAKRDPSGRYIDIGKDRYFNAEVYKRRMRMGVEPFLVDANTRAQQKNTQAYVYAAPTGLGVWLLHPVQRRLLLEVYLEVINRRELPHLSDIQIEWFSEEQFAEIKHLLPPQIKNPGLAFHFSKRNPVAILTGTDKDKLLVASYAWDGNAFPGNEYWIGMLDASGDPAAASCSGIPELQNPYINPRISGQHLFIVE